MSKNKKECGHDVIRKNKESARLIGAIDDLWGRNPGTPFSRLMDEKLFTLKNCVVGTMKHSYPSDAVVLMAMESLYKKDNTTNDVVEIQLSFGNPGETRNSDYRGKFLGRLKRLLKKNPKIKLAAIISSAVMGNGFYSYLTDGEAMERLV